MLAWGGVVLADSADASRCYPDLWRTPAAARQAFHRQRRRVTGRCETMPTGERHAPLRRATYQRAGAGRRPASLIFDPTVVPSDELRSWLEARVGPLARFELAGGSEGYDAPSECTEAPPAVPEAPPGPIHAEPMAGNLSAELQAVRPLQQRRRLAALAQRLWDARPKREHGVRQLDWQAWEDAAQEATGLPTAEWSAWRATVGTEEVHR